jgi:hypothetical protein
MVRWVAGEENDTSFINRPCRVSYQVPPLGRYPLTMLNSDCLKFFTYFFQMAISEATH